MMCNQATWGPGLIRRNLIAETQIYSLSNKDDLIPSWWACLTVMTYCTDTVIRGS